MKFSRRSKSARISLLIIAKGIREEYVIVAEQYTSVAIGYSALEDASAVDGAKTLTLFQNDAAVQEQQVFLGYTAERINESYVKWTLISIFMLGV